MSANSKIQWTDHTFNAWEGCTKVAPECKNCYAETLVDHRFGRAKWGKGQPRRRTSEALWKQPLRWNAIIANERQNEMELGPSRAGRMRNPRVFCLSLGDWLDEEVPIEWLADLLALIHATPHLDWQLLTKRPQNWEKRMIAALPFLKNNLSYMLSNWGRNIPPPNVWIGVSAGADQKAALDIPAKIHFLSCEPMLHPLDTTHAAAFDWIIFGGESGKNGRPCDVQWIREGLTFCRENSVAPFVKQLGKKVIGLPPNPDMRGLRDSHGGDWDEWPGDLRVREFPR